MLNGFISWFDIILVCEMVVEMFSSAIRLKALENSLERVKNIFKIRG
jgi:hypothetical protein